MALLQALQSPGISHVVQLEQWLMEGAYNKVLDARPNLPDPAYGYFMEKLLSTVRYAHAFTAMHVHWLLAHPCLSDTAGGGAPNSPCLSGRERLNLRGLRQDLMHARRDEIADCSERAYSTLSLSDAKKLMLFKSDKEAAAYAAEVTQDWH